MSSAESGVRRLAGHSMSASASCGHTTVRGYVGEVPRAVVGRCNIWCKPNSITRRQARVKSISLGAGGRAIAVDYPLWATCRMPTEQQQRQRLLRLDQIGQCISVQDREKRLDRIVHHAAQHADAFDRAIIAPPQTANNIELVLGLAHHLADIDITRRATQTHAAPTTAHGIEIALATEIVRDLHQMLL